VAVRLLVITSLVFVALELSSVAPPVVPARLRTRLLAASADPVNRRVPVVAVLPRSIVPFAAVVGTPSELVLPAPMFFRVVISSVPSRMKVLPA